MIRQARLGREPGTPDIMPLFQVRVELVDTGKGTYTQRAVVVQEAESYAHASQLCYALNYLFGDRGALTVLGRNIVLEGGEIGELALRIYKNLDEVPS